MAKGTRITIDLASEDLLKAVKFAAVEESRPIREIVIEALKEWLEGRKPSGHRDLHAMMQAVSEYRRSAGLT